MRTRIIAKLDVKPPYTVKPLCFEGLRKIAPTVELTKKYYEQGADEILYLDIVSSLYQREILFNEIEEAAKNNFIPLTVGGGVKSLEDFSKLYHSGADKVSINTYAIEENPNLIDEAAKIFGSQAVVVNIEAKRFDEGWKCYTNGGKIKTDKDVISWANEVQNRGAGEILLQSIDNDGLCKGFDMDLAANIVHCLNIPVVVGSGAGSLEDIKSLIINTRPSGVALASLLHYNKYTVQEVKDYLKDSGIEVGV